jgi:hypothetical protein
MQERFGALSDRIGAGSSRGALSHSRVDLWHRESRDWRHAQHPIDPRKAEEREQLQELVVSLEQVIDHNAFEEAVLFPLICARGGGYLARFSPRSTSRSGRW